MNICDTREHGEIVYAGWHCRACDKIKELKDDRDVLRDELRAAHGPNKSAQTTHGPSWEAGWVLTI